MEAKELAAACRAPLETRQIPFALAAQCQTPSAAARSLLLADAKGKVQLLAASTAFIDLNRLNGAIGRELRPCRRQDVEALASQLGLAALPGVPSIPGVPSWVDESLFRAEQVFLPSGAAQQWVRLEQAAFAKLVADCRRVDCSRVLNEALTDCGDQLNIERAVEQLSKRRVLARLDETLHIPPLPEAARRIIQLQTQPDYDLSDLTKIVESDPSLAAQIVGWANSPIYRARSEVRSVNDAIMRVLGFDLVVNLALGLAVGKSLRVPAGAEGGMFLYWLRSVYMAATVEALARCMPKSQRVSPGLAYLAGLLHNYGYLVLAHVFPPHFQALQVHVGANPQLPNYMIEQDCIGISGEEIAGALLQSWSLPDAVCLAIRFQNAPDLAHPHDRLAQLLQLARLALSRRLPWLAGPTDEITEAQLAKSLNLDQGAADNAISLIVESSEDLEEMANKLTG